MVFSVAVALAACATIEDYVNVVHRVGPVNIDGVEGYEHDTFLSSHQFS